MNVSKIRHTGFLVEDSEKTAVFYKTAFGIGPFKTYDVPFFDVKVRGAKSESFTTRISLARVGETEIELVQWRVLSGRAEYFEEAMQKKLGCMHHLAFAVSNLDEAVAEFKAAGIGVVTNGSFPGGRFAYLDSEAKAGIIYELMEMTPRPKAG